MIRFGCHGNGDQIVHRNGPSLSMYSSKLILKCLDIKSCISIF